MAIRVTMLAERPAAVSHLLQAKGWEVELAQETAAGVASAAVHVAGITTEQIEAMLSVTNRLGIQMISGPDWILLVGPHSRLGAFARPWVQPEAVQAIAIAVGMAMPPEQGYTLVHARGTLQLDRPLVMAIINLTPDSFSDAGLVLSDASALTRAAQLIEQGADLLDLGGESTRPGAVPVSVDEELARVIPVIRAVHNLFPATLLSIDTVKAEVARAAIDAGASIINDVTAGRHDPGILLVAGEKRAGMVLSHSRGPLGQIAQLPTDGEAADIVPSVVVDLQTSWQEARSAGVADTQVMFDPGLGFGKGPQSNLRLLAQLDALVSLGRPVLVGPSRKRFLGEITGKPVADRDRATAAACALAVERGARIVRVHDPAAVRDAVAVAWAMRSA